MHIHFRQLVGVFFLLYALAYAARPDVGAIANAAALFNTASWMLIGLFATCGLIMLMLPVHPPMVALLALPIALMGASSAVRAYNDPLIGWSGVVAHAFTLMLIWRWAWRRAKEGTDD